MTFSEFLALHGNRSDNPKAARDTVALFEGREQILSMLEAEFRDEKWRSGRVLWVSFNVGPFGRGDNKKRKRILDMISAGPHLDVLCAHPLGPKDGPSSRGGPTIGRSSWSFVVDSGASLWGWRGRIPLHAKLLLFFADDDENASPERLIVGSFNLSLRGLTDSTEMYAATSDPSAVENVWMTVKKVWKSEFRKPVTIDHCTEVDEDSHPGWPLVEHSHRPDWERYLDSTSTPNAPHCWQEPLIKEAAKVLEEGDQRGWVVNLPTGAGKTIIAVQALGERAKHQKDFRVLWIAPKHDLLSGAALTLGRQFPELREQVWLQSPEDCPDNPDHAPAPSDRFIFCTNIRAVNLINGRKGFSVVVVDECHHYKAENTTYGAVESARNRSKTPTMLLGMSATPRLEQQGEERSIWSNERRIGNTITKSWLTREGYLSVPEFQRWDGGRLVIDRTALPEEGEDKDSEGFENALRDVSASGVLESVRQAANHQEHLALNRLLVFAMNIGQANKIAEKLNGDVPDCARAIHSQQSPSIRSEHLDWFRSEAEGRRILVNVEMAIEGVDVPKIDGIFLVRPTFSWVYHNQMIGRGLRGPKSGGTDKCTIVDFTYTFVDHEGNEILKKNRQRVGAPESETVGFSGTGTADPSADHGPWPEGISFAHHYQDGTLRFTLHGGNATEHEQAMRWLEARGCEGARMSRGNRVADAPNLRASTSLRKALMELDTEERRWVKGALAALNFELN